MIENFWVFALAALMLNITPGNDMLYVITRSTAQGSKAGIFSSLGIMAGCMVHIIAAMVGLSALIAQSALAFNVIKYAGAAYLIYLGIRSLMSRKKDLHISQSVTKQSYAKLFWQGALTNVLNPKVALFFLAFLPQFIDMKGVGVHWQILLLGSWFNIGGTLVNIVVAVLFGKIGHWLNNSPRFVLWQERITGIILILLGIKVALGSRK
jgi:threonine/homoserine/homoserine lactone efflux protein